jgi:hypothetical protein
MRLIGIQMIGRQILYQMVPHIPQEMNSVKSMNALKPLAMVASIVILLTVSLVPAFADSTSPLLAPTNLNAMPVSGNQITLTWNPPVNATHSGVIGYQIQRNGTILVNNTESTFTNYNDTSLSPGDIGQYQVAAWNAIGIGLLSNNASAATILYPSPTTPGPTPENATLPTYGGNWTKYVIIHHSGQHGIQTGNQTLPRFDRMHIGQFVYGKYNGTSIYQHNGTFYQINKLSPTVNNSQHKWGKQMGQFKLNLMRNWQQSTNLHNGTQTWSSHVLTSAGGNTQTTKSIHRHLSSNWIQSQSLGTNRVSFSGITHGNGFGGGHKIHQTDWKKGTPN